MLVDRGAMPDSLDTAIYLERIDARRNMARYYMLSIQPNLFGGISFIRQWGRIGTAGREKIELMDDIGAAHVAQVGIERAKRRRGYNAPNVDRSSVNDEVRVAC